MPPHIEEGDRSRPALRRVHPVTCPRIFRDVALAPVPDVKPVQRVIKNWQPDSEELQPDHKRKAAKKLNLFGIRARASGGKCIRKKMLNQK